MDRHYHLICSPYPDTEPIGRFDPAYVSFALAQRAKARLAPLVITRQKEAGVPKRLLVRLKCVACDDPACEVRWEI